MTLNDLLAKHDIDPKKVLAFRHSPQEPELNEVLPSLAAEKPDVFNAYQQTQTIQVENAMLDASYVASFIRHPAGRALFIGLYSIGEATPLTDTQFWRIPSAKTLREFGMANSGTSPERQTILWFDLVLMDFYANWKGKLVVDWPKPYIKWWRWAHSKELAVQAILPDSVLDAAMPHWQEISLSWRRLSILPTEWKSALSHWRAIYFIFDTSDGKGYVGSAYGKQNLLGRWLNYAASGDGGNAELQKRDPNNFQFTILERLSPDAEKDEVVRIENTWKERLHTRVPFGLNDPQQRRQ